MAKKNKKIIEELHALSDADLAKELEETRRRLFTVRLQLGTRQLSNTSEAEKVRRRIARILTLQRQRELAVMQQAAGTKGS